jgi:hypothetical protein
MPLRSTWALTVLDLTKDVETKAILTAGADVVVKIKEL